MNEISGATCSDRYDLVFTNDGHISVETETTKAVANILKLDFNSNDDWTLDLELGVHWLNKGNTGLLQVKGSEPQIVSAIQRKLMNTDGVREIESIEISRGLNRSLYIKVVVIDITGKKIELEREV